MDNNTYYAAAMLGRQQEYDDQIIKKVWSNDYQNMTEQEASDSCEDVYEKQGSTAFNKCRSALISCGNDATCTAISKKYSEALSGGYSGTFEDFKKRSGTLSSLGQIGTTFLTGLLANLAAKNQGNTQVAPDGNTPPPPPPPSNTGLYIGLGLVAVLGIGAAVYFGTRSA